METLLVIGGFVVVGLVVTVAATLAEFSDLKAEVRSLRSNSTPIGYHNTLNTNILAADRKIDALYNHLGLLAKFNQTLVVEVTKKGAKK